MRRFLVAAASVLAISFAGAAAQAEDTLKIGLQSAMTGWGARMGQPFRATSEMYVDEVTPRAGWRSAARTT